MERCTLASRPFIAAAGFACALGALLVGCAAHSASTPQSAKLSAAVAARQAVRPVLVAKDPRSIASTRSMAAAAVAAAPSAEQFNGSPTDVMLQGFHWDSIHASVAWYEILRQNAGRIKDAGIDVVWFPPPCQAAFNGEGYMPTRWFVLDSAYGTKVQLQQAITALQPTRAIADVVVNHRNGVGSGGADFQDPPFADNRAAITSDDDCQCGTGGPDTGDQDGGGIL